MMFNSTFRKNVTVSFLTLRRYLRRAVKKDDRQPKFLKGKVITLDNDLGDKIGPADEFRELNRNLRKMFAEPDEIQSEEEMLFEEDNYNSVYEKFDKTFVQQEMDEKEKRKLLIRRIVKQKYFPKPKETNLLTYAAKKQVRYLHQLDPTEWTPERLSQCFPISVTGVKRLLHNNYRIDDEEKIKAHDAEVKKRWESLKSGNNLSEIHPETVRLWQEGKLCQDFYCGNVSLPQPPTKQLIDNTKPKKVGEHLAIIKKYLDVRKEEEVKKLKEPNTDTMNAHSALISNSTKNLGGANKIQQNILPDFQARYPRRSEIEDEQSASYLATNKEIDPSSDPEIPSSQYEENLLEEFTNQSNKTTTDDLYLEWLEKQKPKHGVPPNQNCQSYSDTDSVSVIKKFTNDTIVLSTEETDNKGKVAYLYDPDLGYQYPMGKNVIQVYIKIPPHLYKKGALYRVGQCFYNDTGEFLYKVPFKIKS